MQHSFRSWRGALIGSLAVGLIFTVNGTAVAGQGPRGAGARQQALVAHMKAQGSATTSPIHTPDDGDEADEAAQYDFERTAPSGTITGDPLTAAQQAALALPETGGAWQQFTDVPYNAQPSNYTDPFWGNEGAGFSLVSGRVTALATTADGAWFAGAADGGVWRSRDQGQTWTPVFDSMPSLSIGALAVDPADGSLWVGTGEANQSQDSYAGTGVYRSANDGASWQRVGDTTAGNPLTSHTVFRIAFDQHGNAYAATDNGLFRYSVSTHKWSEVLDPAGPVDNPPYDQQVTDVAIVPGSGGKDVIAAIGWHGPGNTQNNGFYESTDSGATFTQVTPTGDINVPDIGRTTFAYSADGTKLYAIVQSLSALAAGDESVLQGIFVASGSAGNPASVAGPWTKIADEAKLAASGSALAVGSGYGVGVQAWYNQDLAVDPSNPDHVYAGLEEVFESTDGGTTWVTASPYWNYPFPCDTTNTCPNTTHPDQHAMMITDGKIVIGNDGGVYSRPLSDTQQYGDWTDLNATLRSRQYYDARAGQLGRQDHRGLGRHAGQRNGAAVHRQQPDGRAGRRRRLRRDRRPARTRTIWSASTPTARCTPRPTAVIRSPTPSAHVRGAGHRRASRRGRTATRPPGSSPRWSRTSRTRTSGSSAASSSGSARTAGTRAAPTPPAPGRTCTTPALATR